MAHRVFSLQSSASVTFGGKPTSTGRRDRLAQSRMTQLKHRGFLLSLVLASQPKSGKLWLLHAAVSHGGRHAAP
jgi:hypothetical protein